MSVREVNLSDYPTIYLLLDSMVTQGNTLVARIGDAETAARAIASGAVDARVIDEQYLVVFNVGRPWYSDRLVLEELMVLRLRPGTAPFSKVTDFLERMAGSVGAELIMVGGALSDRPNALRRAYRQQGFECADHPVLAKWR